MSDITKLVTLGVITREIELADMKIKLVTPNADAIKGAGVGDIIAQFISSIDGKSYGGEEDKKMLIAVVSQMQSGVVSKIIDICNEMLVEQSELVEGFFSKK